MKFFKKALNWFKQNNRKIEKIALLVGALLIIANGLLFNIYADTKLNISVGYLIFGLLTSIVAGTLLLLGSFFNNFDITYKGLVLVFIGLGLTIFNAFGYPHYLQSAHYGELDELIKKSCNVFFLIMKIVTIVSASVTAIGFGLQIYQKVLDIKNKETLN